MKPNEYRIRSNAMPRMHDETKHIIKEATVQNIAMAFPDMDLHLLELPKTSLMPVPKSLARRPYDKAA
jgi:hypothetical protein